MVASWYYSLLHWNGFLEPRQFVGLDNYVEALRDPYFWNAFRNSFLFMIVVVPLRMILSLIVAIILNGRLRFTKFFRAVFFIPAVTTTAIVGIVFTVLLSPSGGPINQILMSLGIIHAPVDFLGNPQLALPTLMAIAVWKFFGISMVYWLAALQSVPEELQDAAKVDGAGAWARHFHITWPILRPFTVVILIISAVQTLRIFDLISTTTGGGPYFASETMEVYIYRTAFAVSGGGSPQLGYASAAGVIFGVAVLLIALFQGGFLRRIRGLNGSTGSAGA
jgi:multiple sugar transport system permease protein